MKHKGVSEKRVLKVKELNDYTPNLNVDWLSIMNDQLLNSVKLSEDDDILLYSPDTLKSLAADLSTIDKGYLFVTQSLAGFTKFNLFKNCR